MLAVIASITMVMVSVIYYVKVIQIVAKVDADFMLDCLVIRMV